MSNQTSSTGPGMFHQAKDTNASGSNFIDIGKVDGNMNIINVTHQSTVSTNPQQENPRSLPPFIDAPVDLLSAHFTGRGKELEQLKKLFDTDGGDIPARCAVFGMPGLGKTQLALQFANMEFINKHISHVFWISSTTTEKLQEGFANILCLIRQSHLLKLDLEARLVHVRRWFEESGSRTWLIVLDNVVGDTLGFLRKYLPRTNARGRILYTTRTQEVAEAIVLAAGQQHHVVRLDVLDAQDAATLFLKDAHILSNDSSISTSTAEQLVNCVGRLPLAIVQAASFKRNSLYSVERILALYQDTTHKAEMIEWENDLGVYEEKSVAVVFNSLLDCALQEDSAAANFLKLLSFFDAENIALEVLTCGAQKILANLNASRSSGSLALKYESDMNSRTVNRRGPFVAEEHLHTKDAMTAGGSSLEAVLASLIASPHRLPRVIRQLQRLSLLDCNDTATVLHMHDLVNFMIRETVKKGGQWQEYFDCAVKLIWAAVDNVDDVVSPKCWLQCAMIASHVESLANVDDIHSANMQLVRARIAMAKYMMAQGRYTESEAIFHQTLRCREQRLGPEHPDTLDSVHNLASAYNSLGRYGEAESLYGRALTGREKLGFGHPSTLETVNNLALVYRSQGKFSEAEMLSERALAGFEKNLGAEHTDTLTMVNNMASVYHSQGKYREAEALYKRAVTSREYQLGPEHPHTLGAMNNLALAYKLQARYNEAEALYRKALVGWEKQLGPGHPDTLASVDNLASVYDSQGKYGEAEQLYKRALAGREKLLGFEHLSTLITVNNLGLVYKSQGKYSEAEALFMRALSGWEKQLGPENPKTMTTMDNLALVYDFQGKYSEAEALLEKVLLRCEKKLGSDHPLTLVTLNNLAIVYTSLGRYDEAKALFEKALGGREKQLGSSHPRTLATLNCLASIYCLQGQYIKAKTFHDRALTGQEKQLGSEHPDTLKTVNNLALMYHLQGNHDEAETWYGRALVGREKQLGLEHPDTLSTVNHIACLYHSMGRYGEAKVLGTRALDGRIRQLGSEHPDTLKTMQNMLLVHNMVINLSETQPLPERL
ncbi:hypothetical protein SERLA73DRAFT_162897 [Serpula lacrymans var. lacrymans S7.3]|uniref:NB-ARC domain-containing protein n=1 Tax=Serpula lacrymans var. lacrymans (strain S7.3) TaxID=936435 RepID=F8Q9W0_SERL3|nr:hypothetical protein SERLA73DRAFT_162897 [Serpula lacrymans var. lacrymans S7.3]